MVKYTCHFKFTAIYSKTCPSSLHSAETYSEPYQTSKVELFSKTVNSFHPNQHKMTFECLHQISIEKDISKTSQKHLKRDIFFVTSLKSLKNDTLFSESNT